MELGVTDPFIAFYPIDKEKNKWAFSRFTFVGRDPAKQLGSMGDVFAAWTVILTRDQLDQINWDTVPLVHNLPGYYQREKGVIAPLSIDYPQNIKGQAEHIASFNSTNALASAENVKAEILMTETSRLNGIGALIGLLHQLPVEKRRDVSYCSDSRMEMIRGDGTMQFDLVCGKNLGAIQRRPERAQITIDKTDGRYVTSLIQAAAKEVVVPEKPVEISAPQPEPRQSFWDRLTGNNRNKFDRKP
ncbi:MAG TPA: hypothetical protein VFR09_06680 [Alphaproteobacteria bacterium]|nr:hypothetical protein [Alphaproteobacteria bacterium]